MNLKRISSACAAVALCAVAYAASMPLGYCLGAIFQDFEPVLQTAIAVPAFASVSVDAEVDGDVLRIEADVERMPLLEVVGDAPRLTVYIVEDGILHRNQAGISSDTFTHNHVNRICVTDVWGDVVDWHGDRASMHYEVGVDPDWNADNVSVVAFLHESDPEDVAKCKVFNSWSGSIAQSGVKGIDAFGSIDRDEVAEVFTVSAMKVANGMEALPAGVYIERRNGKAIKKTMR